jgi:hypothetical protein
MVLVENHTSPTPNQTLAHSPNLWAACLFSHEVDRQGGSTCFSDHRI